ncbi:MAG: pre-peptidase C-terminal domain-containing protein [Fimbriimonadales bacterium]|nr:pre-peptidase C-terminal domain-containing protein [Fimbriimonadales bacterium]
MRKVALWAGLGAIFLGASAQQVLMTPYLEREPNNNRDAPQVIETPVSSSQGFVVWEALITPAGESDFYRFQITEPGTYSIRVDTNRDTIVQVYDFNGVLIAANNNGGNPDLPLNRLASGVTLDLEAGTYIVEVAYVPQIRARARYALRVFPGVTAPDYDPTEPNDTPQQALYLGRLSGGEFITDEYRFLTYGSNDVDVYRFDLDSTGQPLKIRTQTYVDTVLRVVDPNGRVYENDDSEWDTLNNGASEVRISLAPRGTYYVFVWASPAWGGYYRLRVSAPLPNEIVLRDGDAEFRLRDLRGDRTRNPFNNADWTQGERDHFYQMGWWYRIQDVDPHEFTLGNLVYYDQPTLNQATLAYIEPEGLLIITRYELRRTADAGSILFVDAQVFNFQFQPRTVHLFHYADIDLSGTPTNFARWDGTRMRVETQLDRAWLAALMPYTRWQASAYPSILDALLDLEPTNLSDGTLPLEGDFTGAFQWTLSLAPFAYRTVRVHYALNTNFVPNAADVDRNGCVNDIDLLRLLIEFGSVNPFSGADVNGDGAVSDGDLLQALLSFGAGCQ